MNSKFENNLSKGSVILQLIKFSMPVLLSNLIQSLYNVADMIIVGQFAGTASMSGVNIGGQITFIITNMVFGLSVGATVLVGQYLGSDNRKAIKETIGTLFTTLFIAAVIITSVMLVARDPLLELIKTPAESYKEASGYFFVTTLGIVFIFGYNALSAIMRGMGDSKNPMIFVGIACVTNILLDFILVGPLQMGAVGAAVATVVSQALSMILCVFYLKKNGFVFDFKLESLRIVPQRLKMLLKIGIPTSVQNVTVGISFLFLTTLVNDIGYTASAAVGAVGKLNSFAILPAVAMSSSVSAMCAHNIGAKEIGRAKKTLYYAMAMAFCISVLIFVFVSLFPSLCLAAFGNDPEMIKYGIEYLDIYRYEYLIVPFVFCFNGLFTGAGHSTFSLINGMLSSVIFRIPAAYIFGIALEMGLYGVGLAAPVASLGSLLLGTIFYLSGRWKKLTIIS